MLFATKYCLVSLKCTNIPIMNTDSAIQQLARFVSYCGEIDKLGDTGPKCNI